jgi:hypothetical protein
MNITNPAVTIPHIVLKNHLQAAINWAADLNSSTSARWPTPPTEEEIAQLKLCAGQYWDGIGEIVVLVLGENGRPQAFQCEWDPGRRPPQSRQTLVARIFHIDEVITVVLADGFEEVIAS